MSPTVGAPESQDSPTMRAKNSRSVSRNEKKQNGWGWERGKFEYPSLMKGKPEREIKRKRQKRVKDRINKKRGHGIWSGFSRRGLEEKEKEGRWGFPTFHLGDSKIDIELDKRGSDKVNLGDFKRLWRRYICL